MWQNKNQSTTNALNGNQDQISRKNSNLKREKNSTLATLKNESACTGSQHTFQSVTLEFCSWQVAVEADSRQAFRSYHYDRVMLSGFNEKTISLPFTHPASVFIMFSTELYSKENFCKHGMCLEYSANRTVPRQTKLLLLLWS